MSNKKKDDNILMFDACDIAKTVRVEKELAERLDPLLSSETGKAIFNSFIKPRKCGDNTPLDFSKGVRSPDKVSPEDDMVDGKTVMTVEVSFRNIPQMMANGCFNTLHPTAIMYSLVRTGNYLADLNWYTGMHGAYFPINPMRLKIEPFTVTEDAPVMTNIKYTLDLVDTLCDTDLGDFLHEESKFMSMLAVNWVMSFLVNSIKPNTSNFGNWRLLDLANAGELKICTLEQIFMVNNAVMKQISEKTLIDIMGWRVLVPEALPIYNMVVNGTPDKWLTSWKPLDTENVEQVLSLDRENISIKIK